MTLLWSIGRGLIGSALLPQALESTQAVAWEPPTGKFAWEDRAKLRRQIDEATAAFAKAVRDGDRWILLWTAGSGVIGSSESAIRAETENFRYFLSRLPKPKGKPHGQRGALFFASSAGGIYAGSPDLPIDENSEPRPISEYGKQKLLQEKLIHQFVASAPGISALIGRISNVYGTGQNLTKAQGLISHISRSLFFRSPINIYVPLDSVRDYLFAPDLARAVASRLPDLFDPRSSGVITRIFASEEPRSIAEIIGIFRHLARHSPLVLTSTNSARNLQASRLSFRSVVWTAPQPEPRVPLAIGIPIVHRYNFDLFLAGLLPAPSLR